MKKLKLIFNIYFVICICYASYSFYNIVVDYFKKDEVKKEEKKTVTKPQEQKTTVATTGETPLQPITKVQTNYNYLYNSKMVPVEESMVIQDSSEFNSYKKEYNLILNRLFKPKHLKGIKEIVITDSEAFGDGEIGLTESFNEISYIIIAAKSNDRYCIVHEAIHAMHIYYLDLFNKQFKNEWLKHKQYVSEYAKTNIDEDIAETGTAYLTGDTLKYNPKFKLFKQFYNQILKS